MKTIHRPMNKKLMIASEIIALLLVLIILVFAVNGFWNFVYNLIGI